MEPTQKAPEINKLLSSIAGRDRVTTIRGNICMWCGGPAIKFKDELSRREFTISGMCGQCQDEVFEV